MKYRKLGRTGLEVGEVGLGTEYLWHEPRDTVRLVVDEALDHGVNYIDLWMPSPEVRDYMGEALQGRRDRVILAGHLGSTLKEEQYFRTREHSRCEKYIQDFMTRLRTDYIDILMLHFIDDPDDFAKVFEPGGIFDYALQLKKEGKARFIGMSSHRVPVSMQAVNSGAIDVLMFPVNPAFDILPGDTGLDALWQKDTYDQIDQKGYTPSINRKDLYTACVKQNVGIVAMKPFAGGWLLNGLGEQSLKLSPVQCVHYSLSQPGVSTVVPGCKNVKEMQEVLSYFGASDGDLDYGKVVGASGLSLKGSCMYCNHCLPCPSRIDIAKTTRYADSASQGMTDLLGSKYEELEYKASACIKCGACMKRCPFDVDVISNMERAVGLFGR